MSRIPPVSLEELKTYPTMTSWFRPDLLAKLVWRVVVSEMFGQYADRRLIVAALDPILEVDLLQRAKQFVPETKFDNPDDRPPTLFEKDSEEAVWIDFVADLGDGFDATFAIASLLSQETLKVGDLSLPRGKLLVMGGDEVYPTASPENYRERLIHPYNWAFPDPEPGLINGPPVYAIPGNHDWYDGLVLFLAFFTRRTLHLHLGGWRSWQRRSYFAIQITEKWWIWAMDAHLDDDVDQPQKDYFDRMAKNMPAGSKIILCGPEPGWLYTLKKGNKSLSVVDNIAWSAVNAKANLQIPIIVSGDTHHYSRYSGNDGVTQFITSGGGGAFLHGTHWLEDTVDLAGKSDNDKWLNRKVNKLSLKTSPAASHGEVTEEACYPKRADSRKMILGDFKFVVLNPGFCMLLGAVYWLAGLLMVHGGKDGVVLAIVVMALGFWGYTKREEGNSTKVKLVSLANGLIHSAGIAFSAFCFSRLNAGLPDFGGWVAPSIAVFLLEMASVGFLFGGFLFGAYLYVSSRFLNMNRNDAFSAMRLDTHRNFLRIRIKGDEVTIYPIGLTRVPKRTEWKFNDKKVGKPAPAYVPDDPLAPHLIEGPIVVTTAPAPVTPAPAKAPNEE
jgi:hypothetical protein